MVAYRNCLFYSDDVPCLQQTNTQLNYKKSVISFSIPTLMYQHLTYLNSAYVMIVRRRPTIDMPLPI